MKHLYLGSIVTQDAWLVAKNEKYLAEYLDRAAINNLPFTNSTVFLKNVEIEMQKEFGSLYEITFYDRELGETVGEVSGYSEFHLLLLLKDNAFYSQEVH